MSSPDRHDAKSRGARPRALRTLGSIAYWAAVLAISLALVVGLVLLLESRDGSEIDRRQGARSVPARTAA